jgi:hypothetical protein
MEITCSASGVKEMKIKVGMCLDPVLHPSMHRMNASIQGRDSRRPGNVNEMAIRVSNEGMQVHGGYGFTDEYPISRIYRAVRTGPARRNPSPKVGGMNPRTLGVTTPRRIGHRSRSSLNAREASPAARP